VTPAGLIAGVVAIADGGKWRKFAAGAGSLWVNGAIHRYADDALKRKATPWYFGMFPHAGGGGGIGLGQRDRYPAAGHIIEFDAGQGDAIGGATGATGTANGYRSHGLHDRIN